MDRVVGSPDGRKAVTIKLFDDSDNDQTTGQSRHCLSKTIECAKVLVVYQGKRFHAVIDAGLNAEVMWSPDSNAFSVTGSEGGGLGQYQTEVFYVKKTGLTKIKLTALIERAFGHPVKCGSSESPNVAAVKWLENSSHLLVAAEILPHSNCDSSGTFRAFEVDVHTSRVIKSYNQLRAKQLFADSLGKELQFAEDECIRKPSACYVSTNHEI